MRMATVNRGVLTPSAALLLGACTTMAAAPVAGLPEASQAVKLNSHAEIIAATQGLPASVIAAGDGSIVAGGAGNMVSGGAGNFGEALGQIVAGGAGNLGAGTNGLDGGGAGVAEDLATAKLLDGRLEGGFVSHGPGRVALHVAFPKAVGLRAIRLHFDPRLPLPSHHVLELQDDAGQALSTHLVRHGQNDLRSGLVVVPLGDRQQPAKLRLLFPEGVSIGLKEIELQDVVGQSLAAGATVELKTRAQL